VAAGLPPRALKPSSEHRWTTCAVGVVVLGVLAGVLVMLMPTPAVQQGSLALLVVVATAAVWVGIHGHRPSRRQPWWFLFGAGVCGAVSPVLRHFTAADGITSPLADLAALLGYVCLAVCLLGLIRAREPEGQAGSLADGLLIGVGVLMLLWVTLVSPYLADHTVSLLVRVFYALFPATDALLVFVLARLAFATDTRVPSLVLLVGAMVALLVGDLSYALVTAKLVALPASALAAPYVVMYGLLGAAVLHPSMRLLTEPAVRGIRPLPRSRLFAMLTAMLVPTATLLIRPFIAFTDRAAFVVGLLVVVGLSYWRMARAVREHAVSEQRLAYLASHDALTGLANRNLAVERLNELLGRLAPGRAVAALFVDLDGFKSVNDTWGHPTGDALLLQVGARLDQIRRDADLIARIGGDEFLVITECDTSGEELAAVAERTLEAISMPYMVEPGAVWVSANIGIACSSDLAQPTAQDLVRNADIAMYRAKEEAHIRWVRFSEGMRAGVVERLETERALRGALDREEIVVHYQPIIDLSEGVLIGFEALVRWDSPEHGLVPPGKFIPVIEATDLILPVGALVLRRAALQLAQWRRQWPGGEQLWMSVNIAARQLRDPGLLEMVRDVLDESGLPEGALVLEMTESAMVQDDVDTLRMLSELRGLGIELSVDDFGTGYSSLRYLTTFPVSTVKIDRSFVQGLDSGDQVAETIVRAVVQMSHALRLKLVAEGIETDRQHRRLRALNCDAGQGYLYARPGPPESAVPPSLVETLRSDPLR
jgi:diguanylate cyclase (GGDEF)-like protein